MVNFNTHKIIIKAVEICKNRNNSNMNNKTYDLSNIKKNTCNVHAERSIYPFWIRFNIKKNLDE